VFWVFDNENNYTTTPGGTMGARKPRSSARPTSDNSPRDRQTDEPDPPPGEIAQRIFLTEERMDFLSDNGFMIFKDHYLNNNKNKFNSMMVFPTTQKPLIFQNFGRHRRTTTPPSRQKSRQVRLRNPNDALDPVCNKGLLGDPQVREFLHHVTPAGRLFARGCLLAPNALRRRRPGRIRGNLWRADAKDYRGQIGGELFRVSWWN
jgi:hypothetical protein